ncbi:MAG: Ig-like domain-containing protein [Alistipes sp.]
MKNKMLYCAMLLCVTAILGSSACSDSTPKEIPNDNKLQTLVIEPATLPLMIGQTATLSLRATPETASLENVRWSSRDSKIASIEAGTVTAIAVGTTTLTAACDGVIARCEVTVTKKPIALEKIELKPSVISIKVGTTTDIVATLVPENAQVEGAIVWASNTPAVATVDSKGHVVAVANGKTTLTATIGAIVATCNIEVYSQTSARTFTFLQLNLWEGLSNIDNGRTALYNQLIELKPDAASFCEFRSAYEADEVLQEAIAALLKSTGIQYYASFRQDNGTRGLLTRHPILSTDPIADEGWFYRTVIDFYGQQMALYASHAYHAYYACYLPRGYGDGGTPYDWNKLPNGPITDIEVILKREEISGRTLIAQHLIPEMKAQHDQGRLSVFGGDLNQPSHLDWTEATKDRYEHNGCVVAWPISTLCYAAGIRDAYRTVYPNPVTHPGVTWPVSNKDAKKVTQWAAEADERDRIDFVYYLPEDKFAVQKAQIVGPSAMISKSQVVEDTFVNKTEELITPTNNTWPTDHRGLLITFEVKFAK